MADKKIPSELAEQLQRIGESFTQMLLRLMEEQSITVKEFYHKAHIDRRHFYKIQHTDDYRPQKRTVLLCAIALKLDMKTTQDLLGTAGYAFSNSSVSDIIVQYCIRKGKYDLFYINELLYYYNQELLGTKDECVI